MYLSTFYHKNQSLGLVVWVQPGCWAVSDNTFPGSRKIEMFFLTKVTQTSFAFCTFSHWTITVTTDKLIVIHQVGCACFLLVFASRQGRSHGSEWASLFKQFAFFSKPFAQQTQLSARPPSHIELEIDGRENGIRFCTKLLLWTQVASPKRNKPQLYLFYYIIVMCGIKLSFLLAFSVRVTKAHCAVVCLCTSMHSWHSSPPA